MRHLATGRVPALLMAAALVFTACSETAADTTTTAVSSTTSAPPPPTTQPVPDTTTTTTVPLPEIPQPPEGTARIHYRNPAGDYAEWVLHIWEDADESVTWDEGLPQSGQDAFGIYWNVSLKDDAETVGFIVHRGDEKDPGPDMFFSISELGREIWFTSGNTEMYPHPLLVPDVPGDLDVGPAEPLATGFARIHYNRPDGAYDGFELHAWEDTTEAVTWETGIPISGSDAFGAYWDVALAEGWEQLGFIVHKGDEKDPGPDMFLLASDHGPEAWIVSGSETIHTAIPDISNQPVGDLAKAQAYWLAANTIAWSAPDDAVAVSLHSSADASLQLGTEGLVGGDTMELTLADAGLPAAILEMFPHLAGFDAYTLADPARAGEILQGQFAVAATDAAGTVVDATGLQIPGVLDDLYAYDGPLGVTFAGAAPTLRLWAPTAQQVRLQLFNTTSSRAADAVVAMERSADGVWSTTGDPSWYGKFYRYEVTVFAPATGRIERNAVTDPYSFGLSLNSDHSQIVDLADPALVPLGWDATAKPELAAFEDIVLYELHIRDFSAQDPTVPEDLQGTYLAFTLPNSDGSKHLSRLADAGLTHVHLLPAFDIATIDEDKDNWADPGDLSGFPPDSEEQQAAIEAIYNTDAFNWGYDPLHYTVPEGSYSTDPDGTARILEFRQMVQALNEKGLRVVMDVVYNHTNSAGQAENSVLDRIVPGYYHRLDGNGRVATSTCCANTATEHEMMERLMVDSVVTWATAYKVDGFRFDLMGHHMVEDMATVRAALDALTVGADGVDGSKIYVYGEGWDFGEVQDGARGPNATQLNVGGLGIGTFNDRIRDAIRGGSPFDGLQEQGFATGAYTDPNDVEARPAGIQKADLLLSTDQIRVGLAGNLAAYTFTGYDGSEVTGAGVDYNGAPTGYTTDPQEVINYATAHDNETMFDLVQFKAPLDTPMEYRVRMQEMAISLVGYAQGVPFFHAGIEMLRSKAGDKDSYNSGDWFNALDFSYATNGWGEGLPVAAKNTDRWDILRPLLGDPDLVPEEVNIRRAVVHLLETLEVRASSPLFRLQTAADVMERVRFHNTGPDQIPGMIVMSISDEAGADLDANHELVVVVFNATPEEQEFAVAEFADRTLTLHPVLADSIDPITASSTVSGGAMTVPALTTAVFVVAEA